MADIHRQRLVDEVDTRLKTILISNGYLTDLGRNVKHWYTGTLKEDSLAYRDVDLSPGEGEAYDTDFWILTFNVEVALLSGNATPEMARKVFADIYKALGTDELWTITVTDPNDTELATKTSYLGDVMEVEHEQQKVFSPTLSFAIYFHNTSFDPFISGT